MPSRRIEGFELVLAKILDNDFLYRLDVPAVLLDTNLALRDERVFVLLTRSAAKLVRKPECESILLDLG